MINNTLVFTGVLVKESGIYSALCLELDVASQGKTVKEAKESLAEAATLYLETAIESNLPYMRPIPVEDDPRRTTPEQVVETFPLRVNIAVTAYA